jgi:hypothetical protein
MRAETKKKKRGASFSVSLLARMDLNEDLSWRQCNYLGFLELDPVLDEPLGAGDHVLGAVSHKRPNDRRSEEEEDSDGKATKTLRSNKDRVVQVGVPETLPSFRQNTLQDAELVLVESVVTREKQLRTDVQALYTKQKSGGAEPAEPAELRQALASCVASVAEQKKFISQSLGASILKPGSLAVLDQVLLSLEELEVVASVCEAELRGERKKQVAMVFVEDSFGKPLKQDETVTVTMKLVRSPNFSGRAAVAGDGRCSGRG